VTKIYKIGILAVLGKVLISTDRSLQRSVRAMLSRLTKHGRVNHSHIYVLLTFPSAPAKSDLLQFKFVELLSKLLSSGDNTVQYSAAGAPWNLADPEEYGIVKLSRTAVTYVWKQTEFNRTFSNSK
jgi:hypothetical protein